MFLHAKQAKSFVAWEFCLALIPSLLSTQVFGFTPLTFEDHLVTLACMHILFWIFIPLRYAKGNLVSLQHFVQYALSWLTFFTITSCVAALILDHCGWGDGLTWLALLLWPSGLFLSGLLYAVCLRTSSAWRCRLGALFILCILTLPNVFDLVFTPTMYVYHFSAGYIPGPLFDAWIPQWSALFYFRIWTLGMALFFFANAHRFRLWTFLLIAPFLFRTDLGFRSTHASIQETLGRIQHSQYAKIITNQDLRLPLSKVELASLDENIQHLSASLDVQPPTTPVRIYVYEDPVLKKKLTGTHWTMIGNPIQRSLHLVDLSASDSLLPHELSHVISKPLGLTWLGTGRNIALTEGLAMAMQQEYEYLPLDQWAAYMLSLKNLPSLTSLFSNVSFFQNNATRSYNTAGSFIQWLLATYPAKDFSIFYTTSNAQKAYNQTLATLESQWHDHLQTIKIDPILIEKMQPALSRPPVFLQKCVHTLAALRYTFQHECKTQTCKNHVIDRAKSCNPNDSWANNLYVKSLLQQPEAHADELKIWLAHTALSKKLKNQIRFALSMDWQPHANPAELWLWNQKPQWLSWYWRGLYDFMDQITVTPPQPVIWILTENLHPHRHAAQLEHFARQLEWQTGTPVQQTLLHRKMLRRFEYLGQPVQALDWLMARPPTNTVGQAWFNAQVRRLKTLQLFAFQKTQESPVQTARPLP